MPATAPQGKSTQDTLLISEIKDGIVIMKDGSLRGVIMGSAINFDLMSGSEQEAVENSYQGFLNSLHFPIQIVVKSQKIDVSGYLEKLDTMRAQQANELLANLMDDYIANIRALVDEVNIMDKQFYVVIPYFPMLADATSGPSLIKNVKGVYQPPAHIQVSEKDFHQYKQELQQRMALAANGMSQLGIRAISLGTQELVDLYYSWYNPDTAASQKLVDPAQLTTAAVTKGDGQAPRGPLPGVPV